MHPDLKASCSYAISIENAIFLSAIILHVTFIDYITVIKQAPSAWFYANQFSFSYLPIVALCRLNRKVSEPIEHQKQMEECAATGGHKGTAWGFDPLAMTRRIPNIVREIEMLEIDV